MIKETGLTNDEVEVSRKKYGSNEITSHKKRTFIEEFIETLGDPIIKILLVALMIKTVFLFKDFDWFETIGIAVAILVASLISTISEYGSEKAFTRLQEEFSKIKCKVLRNGKIEEVIIDEVVVGDIIKLETGDKIPADGIIISGNLSVDESSLNGETKEKYKEQPSGTIKEQNKVYRGSIVYQGTSFFKVTSVGERTIYGNIAKELEETSGDSPLKLRLANLAKVISKIGYISALMVALSYLFKEIVIDNGFDINLIIKEVTNLRSLSGSILYALTLAVTIIVVAVPEGLPMMITLVLSSNMRRLLKNNVLVRKLVGIETAGSLNILFTDKTGTLTKGKLEVVGFKTASGKTFQTESELTEYRELYKLVNLSLTYNNESQKVDNKIIGGNITDRALRKFITIDIPGYNKLQTKTFDSKTKYASTIIDYKHETEFIKGSPELLLDRCTTCYSDNGNKILFSKDKIINEINLLTSKGIRLLVLATADKKDINTLKNLTFLGIILIKDELRDEIDEAIRLVNDAGINVVMITGDNKETAKSIAKEAGIIKSDKDIVLTSDELNKLTDNEVIKLIPRLKVVARSLPQDKSRLVKLSKSQNLVVGMTGDGVNDAPALKQADVGFSMGSGTEVAKEASDIVILDDNFFSITRAILFGRTIFKSIRRFIIFQLTINMCAISLSILGPFIGIESPVTVIQMLWINMIMDSLAALAFSYEAPLVSYMKEKPKRKDENILNKYMISEIVFTGIYSSILCLWFLKSDFVYNMIRVSEDNRYLMTAFFGLFIFMSIFNSFNARTNKINLFYNLRKNIVFIIVILFICIVQIYLIYCGGSIFRTYGLTIKEFLLITVLAATVIPVDFLRKFFLRYNNLSRNV